MLPPDEWDSVLGRITGTIYRGTERISSNALLNLLEVGPDPPGRGWEEEPISVEGHERRSPKANFVTRRLPRSLPS